jgi:fibro-slime domain-containing protein
MPRNYSLPVSFTLLLAMGCSGASVQNRSGSTGGQTSAAGATTCPAGSEGCACYGNSTCDGDLSCFSHLCVAANVGGSSGGGASNAGGAGGTSNAGIVGGASSTGTSGDLGGTTNTAGSQNLGGGSSQGGASGSGVLGGSTALGGLPSTGGVPVVGGGPASGGSEANGGAGGASVPAGGAPAGGDTSATGGASGTGGTTSPPGVITCGDGRREGAEACDDGNLNPSDGCSPTCTVEGGFSCADASGPDVQPCPSESSRQCVVLPMVLRDFDGQQATSGHPDFFYRGATINGTKTLCVPDASGTPDASYPKKSGDFCGTTDAVELCSGLLATTLGADGKPQLNIARSGGSSCPCRFTDWDDTGVLTGVTGLAQCIIEGSGGTRDFITGSVQMIHSAESFAQWYSDSDFSTKVSSSLELAQVGSENLYRFSSARPEDPVGSPGRTVNDDLHDICLASTHVGALSSGFFPLESQSRTKVCNIWPYWLSDLATTCCAGSTCPVLSQWDPKAAYDNCPAAGTGGPVPTSDGTGGKINGTLRNFYFTSEVRFFFRFTGGETLDFLGDDDAWVFINGQLAIDLGATHTRLQGTVSLASDGASPWTIRNTNWSTGSAVTVGTGTVQLGLELGKTYEVAVFQAERHPRDSNYQLTLNGFHSARSICSPN